LIYAEDLPSLLASLYILSYPLLDIGCFAPLKHYYHEGVQVATQEGVPKIINKMFMDLYRGAHDFAFTGGNIKSA
jgi:hypothetical protein